MSELRIRATIVTAGPAAAIELSDEQVADLGGGKRAPVRVTIGGVTERLRVAVMGGRNLIGVRKEVRASFGVEAGDVVDAHIALDDAPREVDVPGDLAAALDGAGLRARFDALAFTHRREYVEWIDGAKKPETRARRVSGTIEGLTSD